MVEAVRDYADGEDAEAREGYAEGREGGREKREGKVRLRFSGGEERSRGEGECVRNGGRGVDGWELMEFFYCS
jgi:hypothetical protein